MNSIKQGETAVISIVLDEALEDELCIGIYRAQTGERVLAGTNWNGTLKGSGKEYSVTLEAHQTRNMLDEYYMELMVRNDDQTMVCISDRVTFSVTPSKLGKECI